MKTQQTNVVPIAEPTPLATPEEAYRPLVQTWVLRALVGLEAHREVGDSPFAISAGALADLVGLEPDPGEDMEDAFTPYALTRRLRELEEGARRRPSVLSRNLERLAAALRLTRAEAAVLEFILVAHRHGGVVETCALLGSSLSLGELSHALGVMLQLPEEEVGEALGPRSGLLASGVIRIGKKDSSLLDRVEVLVAVRDAIGHPGGSGVGLLQGVVEKAPLPELTAEDFVDHQRDYDLLKRYLAAVLDGRGGRGNILVHGPAGVGKTQMVRALCAELGADLYEAVAGDSNGDTVEADQRIKPFNFGRRLLSGQSRAVLAFDGFDELAAPAPRKPRSLGHVFDELAGGEPGAEGGPAPVPVFWLARETEDIDAELMARFDVVVGLQPMGPRSRRRLLEAACSRAGLAPGPWVRKAADCPHLTPDLIRAAFGVMSCTGVAPGQTEAETFERIVNGKLGAMGFTEINLRSRAGEIPYKIEYLNADTDLEALVEGLRRNQEGRLLCYGPPGTGKTAFAHHLAEELNLPLLQFRASDILAPFVGQTEQNLAAAFKQAKAQGAVMLLDEIDSLLRSREGAQHTWEVTQVNELLVQTENYPGILVACTNFDELLDPAASRRFDLKIHFGYLKPEVARQLLSESVIAGERGHDGQNEAVHEQISRMSHLTVGDIARVMRRVAVGSADVEEILGELSRECDKRGGMAGRPIGFHASF